MIDRKLLEILVCPLCKVKVEQVGKRLVCAKCSRKYPVRDGIPVMLIDQAELPQNEKEGRQKERTDA